MNTSVPVEGVEHLSVRFFRSREGEGMIQVISRGKKPERIVRVIIYRTDPFIMENKIINEDFKPDEYVGLDSYWLRERLLSLPILINEYEKGKLCVKIVEI